MKFIAYWQDEIIKVMQDLCSCKYPLINIVNKITYFDVHIHCTLNIAKLD